MRKTREFNWGWKLWVAISSIALVLMLGVLAEPFSIVSNAQSQGKVIARSANIRKDANSGSEVVGSAAKDATVTINNQVTGSDNAIWYQIFVDANTLGYIRADLVEITDGTTPPTATATDTTTTTDASTDTTATTDTPAATSQNPTVVTAVEPVSATVSGSQSVRVRSDASTGSQIVVMAQNGLALTVTGQANGTDGKIWYQVNFISDGSEVVGFIRSDYVTLSGELVPVTAAPETPVEGETPQDTETPAEPEVVVKDWDTQYDNGKWYLIDNVSAEPGRYEIENIFKTVQDNQKLLEEAQGKAKSQTVLVILLVILALVLVGIVTVLIMKIKDMKDSAYFAEVERETVRRRTADRPTATDKKVMHTVGAEKRPVATRPAGAPQQGGQRPVNRPAAPVQGGQRPVNRPAGAPVQGGQKPVNRPAGAPVQGGQKPVNRPAGAPVQGGQRPVNRPAGAPPQGATRVAAPAQNNPGQVNRPAAPTPQQNQNINNQNSGWKSKNFMADDDEFEFEFLNWDGEEE